MVEQVSRQEVQRLNESKASKALAVYRTSIINSILTRGLHAGRDLTGLDNVRFLFSSDTVLSGWVHGRTLNRKPVWEEYKQFGFKYKNGVRLPTEEDLKRINSFEVK